MGKCVVKDCNSRSQKQNKSSGITFHAVPKDPERCEKWVKIIRLLRKETDWLPSKASAICSKHFRNEDKIGPKGENGRVYLSNNAVPILDEKSRLEGQMELLPTENMDLLEDVETDEEMEIITESYKMHKMRQIVNRLKLVSTRRLQKIRNLLQKNRRLKIQNNNLKGVIQALKKGYVE